MVDKSKSRKKIKTANKRKGRMSRKKPAAELEATRRKEKIMKGALGMFLLVIFLTLLIYGISRGPVNTTEYSSAYNIVGDEAQIALSSVTSSASFYNYNAGGVDVKFFVVEGSDGDVHTAFDACDVCYQEKKGYYQDGSNMVCRNCGQRFTTNQIGTANQGGGCWPSYLKRTINGGNVIIKTQNLEAGKSYFK